MRDYFAVLFCLGIPFLIPPATGIGVIVMIFAGVCFLGCPVVEAQEAVTLQQAEETGGGCLSFLVSLVLAAAVCIIAAGLAASVIPFFAADGM